MKTIRYVFLVLLIVLIGALLIRADSGTTLCNANGSGVCGVTGGGTGGATATVARQNLGVKYVVGGIFGTNASPADGATNFIALGGAIASTEATNTLMAVSTPGTVTRVCVSAYNNGGTQGSNETFTATVRKNKIDTSMTLTLTWNAANGAFTSTCVTANTFTVAAADVLSVKFVGPTWATNPTNVNATFVAEVQEDQ